MIAGVRAGLQSRWQAVTGSLWFVPALLITGSVGLALVLIELSAAVDREALRRFPRVFGAGADSSRSMLSTIAGAMMTVAGVTFSITVVAVTFSITVVAVTQASSQYTPRILRNFMRDRPSQIALGTLTGVFVYCRVVLRTVRGDEEIRFIPALAVLGAFVLAVAAIGVLVYFIHHIAGSLQASGILDRVRRETTAAVERLFPEELGEEPESPSAAAATAAAALARVTQDGTAAATWRVVPARHTGYLSHIDAEGLGAFAAARNSVVRMERGVGEYVVAGTPLCAMLSRQRPGARHGAAPHRKDAAALNALYTVAVYRTVDQDPAFGIRQMVDIPLKALSPGINDTTTAMMCVDSLGAVLVHLVPRCIERRLRMVDGELRVITRGSTFASLVGAALDEIRRSAEGNVSVLARLLSTLETVVACTASEGRRAVLREHAMRIHATSERTVADPQDRGEVSDAFRRVERALAPPAAPSGAGLAMGV